MKNLIIAIDGPVGSGKSTVARRVAELMGYTHLDSGAMYRALALAAMRRGIALEDAAALERLASETKIVLVTPGTSPAHSGLEEENAGGVAGATGRRWPEAGGTRVLVNGEDVTAAIRTPEMSQAASRVASHAGVRRPLVAQQQAMAAPGRDGLGRGVVMEGRDIGTVVFPQAELKIYLDASAEVRAERRLEETRARGTPITFEQMLAEVRQRDVRDSQRAASPLRRAPDAVYVDCSAMDAEEVARLIALLAREREQENQKRTQMNTRPRG